MAAFEETNPTDAHARMIGATPHAYLDVRTEEEFEEGHAQGAVNVPIATFGDGGMEMNEDFVRVVAAKYKKDQPLVVGCKMGGRSRKACEVLASAGFTKLVNIDGGFGGNPGSANDSAKKGWARSGLPVATTPAPGSTYAELKQAAK
jgi:rhodanese-related sulfurtransferase